MGEAIFIVCLLAGFLGWTFLMKGIARIYWAITMSTIGVVIGTMEIIGTVREGKTISRMFWEWSVDHVVLAHVSMGLMLFGIVVLIVHLMWNIWFPKNKN